MVLPNQAEGNPFFNLVDEVWREGEEGPIKMKLEKARLFLTEQTLNTLLNDLVSLCVDNNRQKKNKMPEETQMLRL